MSWQEVPGDALEIQLLQENILVAFSSFFLFMFLFIKKYIYISMYIYIGLSLSVDYLVS